jgi:nucleoside 2-deoxyribosyltransferase
VVPWTRVSAQWVSQRSRYACAWSSELEAAGWERTFTWQAELGAKEDYPAIATAELSGVEAADALVVLLPGGFGTHVEIGAALALGKPVVIHAPDRKTLETPYPCVFHYHPNVELMISAVLNADAMLACLQRRLQI